MLDLVPEFPPNPQIDKATSQLRQRAPNILLSLIEQGILENINSINDLPSAKISILGFETGMRSACYLVINNGIPRVVKLGIDDLGNEINWLNQWSSQNVPTPQIVDGGKIEIKNGEEDTKKQIFYIIEELVVDQTGQPALTCLEFFNSLGKKTPTEVIRILKLIGNSAGKILARMHNVQSSDKYRITDETCQPIEADDYRQLLTNRFESLKDIFSAVGILPDDLIHLNQIISQVEFTQGVYTHGDYCPRNLLIRNANSGELVVFDPKPVGLIADTHFDLAFQANQAQLFEYLKKNHPKLAGIDFYSLIETTFTDAMLSSYESNSDSRINNQKLLLHQILLLATHIKEENIRQSEGVKFSQARNTRYEAENKLLFSLTKKLFDLGTASA